MGESDEQANLTRFEPPLPEDLTEELIAFWKGTFGTPYEGFRAALQGAERAQNRDVLYLMQRGERLGGTCRLTVSRANPRLGGVGEVATSLEFRRQGIAGALCARALEDFGAHGGQALFLGTSNPDAARVYHRLGWRKLPGANVMAFIAGGDSPEAFLVDLFREGGAAAVGPGTAVDRIPMIPLLISPHDWQALDANAGMFSTRYVVQISCMSLYTRYEALTREGRGAWFSARTDRGLVVGLSSACLDGSGGCRVDGFTHPNDPDVWKDLIQAAMRWGTARGAPSCRARVSVEDEDKRTLFEALGFQEVGTGEAFDLEGKQVASVLLER